MTRHRVVRAALLLAVAGGAALAWALLHGRLDPNAVQAAVGEPGALAPLIFVAAFAAATVVFLPGSLFGLAGGVLFGPLWGAVWNLIGGTLGATIAFLIARFVGGGWIAASAGGRLETVLSGVAAEGWRFVALTRLVPIVPFNALNYVLGLTRIPLWHYVLATLVCMAPGALAYAWLGHAGRAAAAGGGDALRYAALGLAALALVAFAPRLARRLGARSDALVAKPALCRARDAAHNPGFPHRREVP